jgi:hypothetical protein
MIIWGLIIIATAIAGTSCVVKRGIAVMKN